MEDKLGFIIVQGNSDWLNRMPGSSRIFGASNPNSFFYTGTQMEICVYNKNTDLYNNYSNNEAIISQYSRKKNIEYRKFNFLKMNPDE